ncbi:hypothetical protein AAFF_G00212740 [Aldrovandia affinis]|uniref:Fork-head domain-containing protein n=1 Tax=Aldrovandia affinis TaxID=143900 RepID=A0AAD7W5E5_9TELE|nr:hypothetical protein AAFF_G00212740 [Aldrovandia affinis]
MAVKFKDKWLSSHPEDRDGFSGLGNLDDSLTNLQWLQDFSILTANLERLANHSSGGQPPPRSSRDTHATGTGTVASPSSPHAGDTAASGAPLHALRNPVTPSATAAAASDGDHLQRRQQATQHVHHHRQRAAEEEQVDYGTNRRAKPPHSYATLICMAMRASDEAKVTLSAIYAWIAENFCYYRHAEPSWQNSIRHNLSLNKCFLKVPRTQEEEPGKGGFWQIDPRYAHMFVDGVFKRRRPPPGPVLAPGAAPQHPHKRRRRPSLNRGGGSPSGGSALLSPRPEEGGASADVLDWALWFEDGGSGGTFEDLDISAALSSVGCGPDAVLLGGPLVAGGRWCGRSVGAELAPFSQQPHPWAELGEEFQPAPVAMDHAFGCYAGFLHEPLPWEGVESYL